MPSIIPRDTELTLPDHTLVSASAGSGKTTALTYRLLQLLISQRIPFNKLQNILAVTFTNNAAAEMKQRTLEYLKRTALGEEKVLRDLREIIALDDDELQRRSENLIDEILDTYSDFQVQTIDSFLTRVTKVSAVEFGLPPEFDIVFDNTALLDESFSLFAKDLADDVQKRTLVEELIELVNEHRASDKKFIWNPYDDLAAEIKDLYKRLSSHAGVPVVVDPSIDPGKLRQQILDAIRSIGEFAERSGFEMTKNYIAVVQNAREGDFGRVIGKALDQNVLKKSRDAGFQRAVDLIEELQSNLMAVVAQHQRAVAQTHYTPYVKAYHLLSDAIAKIQQRRAAIDLAFANKILAARLAEMDVPEIYFSLGERIHHFLIDEFQDTNPIQWQALRPLIEDSLGEQGSAFIVGDTKQAIYTFRGGDWQIMARMWERDEFASVKCRRKTLSENFRSGEAIVNFTKKVFHEIVPREVGEEMARLSGLSSFVQEPYPENIGKGYVEVEFFQKDESSPEKRRVLQIISDCLNRKYDYGDITLLTPKNRHVVEVSSWLNEAGIPFVSHSNLDIRARKITGELLTILRFLDSPIDDLAFATILLSDVFTVALAGERMENDFREFLFNARQGEDRPRQVGALYTIFREHYGPLWEKYLKHLFTIVGYMPVYDLVAEVYKAFGLFDAFPNEEASLVKLLEVVRDFETSGSNSLKDFLKHAEESADDDAWTIAVAPGENAVRVMTIHKAKGLGFPIGIVLLYDSTERRDNLGVVENNGELQLVRLTKDLSEALPALTVRQAGDQTLRNLYEEKRTLQKVDELNKLYVALTRAKEELYVLSVKAERSKTPSSYLPAEGYSLGKKSQKQKEIEKQRMALDILHAPTRGFLPAKETKRLGIEETRRGEFIHAILEHVEYVDSDQPDPASGILAGVKKQLDGIIKMLGDDQSREFNLKSIMDKLTAILSDGLQSYFVQREGRRVLNEQEIVGPDGKLYRIDRLVVDADAVTVIDYKTGSEDEEYHDQVRGYMKLVQQIYPERRVSGILAYVDLHVIRTVT